MSDEKQRGLNMKIRGRAHSSCCYDGEVIQDVLGEMFYCSHCLNPIEIKKWRGTNEQAQGNG